ncbi:MAG TPA: pilus assembly protein N-terminal domain-containing protein, partial [Pirellulaceae bacterium]|nr:pilus assembly protein N-terminal domain-containing protein [Pirellulaceae bacterium]
MSTVRPVQALAPIEPKEPSEATRRDLARLVARTIDPEQTLDLIVDQPRILVLRATPTRIYIAQDSVASYDVVSDTEVAVVGKTPGRTVLTLWMPDPENRNEARVLSYLLRVREDTAQRARLEETYAELEREINRHFPDSRVKLSLISDQLVVRGQAKDVIEAGQIMRIVQQNAPPTRRAQVEAAKKSAAVRNGGAGLSSDLPRDSESSDVENLAAAADLQGEPQVVNLLQIPGEQQVMLRVTVAEVNRSALRSVGANLNVTGGSGIGFQSAFPGGSLLQDAATGANALEGGTLSITRGDLRLTVNALKQHNLARTLAEPNLVTLHGRSARFQAGGQFPIPAAQVGFGAAAQGVEFVPIGVQLQFIPYIVDRDKIRLTMAANVSTRDEGQSAQVGGTSVPGINTRNFQNT